MTLYDRLNSFIEEELTKNPREPVPVSVLEKWISRNDPNAIFSYEDDNIGMIYVEFSDGSSISYMRDEE